MKKSEREPSLLLCISDSVWLVLVVANHNKMYSLAAILVVSGFEQGYGTGSLFFLSLQSILDLEALRLVLCKETEHEICGYRMDNFGAFITPHKCMLFLSFCEDLDKRVVL